LGHGDKVNKVRPTLVQALEGLFVSQITCGWSHSVALSSRGTIYTWGNGDHGKLGHGSGKKLSAPQIVAKLQGHKVIRVASYNEHTAALVEPIDASGVFWGAFGSNSIPVTTSYVQDMRDMVDEDEYSDVTFLVEGQKVNAHRAILAGRCEHFAAMFRSGMRESVEREIAIPNITKTVFVLLMEYLYTDSVRVDLEHAVELFMIADLYQLDRLRDICSAVVKRNLTVANAPMLLQSSADVHCQVLKDICMEFVVTNFDSISKKDEIKAVSHTLLLEILSNRP